MNQKDKKIADAIRSSEKFLADHGFISSETSQDPKKQLLSTKGFEKPILNISSPFATYEFEPYVEVAKLLWEQNKNAVYVPPFALRFYSDGILGVREVSKLFEYRSGYGSRVVGSSIKKELVRLCNLISELLASHGVKPTPARVIQLWSYTHFLMLHRQSIKENGIEGPTKDQYHVRVYELIANDIDPFLALISLTTQANHGEAQEKYHSYYAYSIDALRSLNSLPRSYIIKLLLDADSNNYSR